MTDPANTIPVTRGPFSGDFAIGDDLTAGAPTQPIPLYEVAGDHPLDDDGAVTLAEIRAASPGIPAADFAALDQLAPGRRHTVGLEGGGAITITRLAPSDVLDDEDAGEAFAAPEGPTSVIHYIGGRPHAAPALIESLARGYRPAVVIAFGVDAAAGPARYLEPPPPGASRNVVGIVGAPATDPGTLAVVGEARDAIFAVLAETDPNDRIAALVEALISDLNDAPIEIGRDLAHRIVVDLRARGPK